MPSPLPFVHLFVSRIKAPLPFHLLAYSYLARSATKPISLQRTPPRRLAEGCTTRLSTLGSRHALHEFHVENRRVAVRGGTGSHLFDPKANRLRLYACVSRERAAFTMRPRSRAPFLLLFFPFLFFLFSPPLSSTRALIQNILAARQVAPVDARSRLTDSTNSRQSTFRRVRALPTYLPTTFLFHPRG